MNATSPIHTDNRFRVAVEARRAAKWDRLSRRKEVFRLHQKATGCEIPPAFEVQDPKCSITKLEAQSSAASYLDSFFIYSPHEYTDDDESQIKRHAMSPKKPPLATKCKTTIASKVEREKRSRPSQHSMPVRYIGGDVSRSKVEESVGEFAGSIEYMRLVLDPEIDSSGIMPMKPGRKERQQETREADLSSSDNTGIGSPQKRSRRTTSNPQNISTSVSNPSRADLTDRTKKITFATQNSRGRGSSSSSGLLSGSETNMVSMLDGKQGYTVSYKERSRSPPKDREATESSEASRFHIEKGHSAEHIIDQPAAKHVKQRRDSGCTEEPENRDEQCLDHNSNFGQLQSGKGCSDSTKPSSNHSTEASESQSSHIANIVSEGERNLRIDIAPPSPYTNKTILKQVSTQSASRLIRPTKE
ncbi:hypothetical protein ONS95_007827 [Cadophora gregata]|uniref:uncharacterized protein n=1 Tax=Cadophora gregata TaxID=51156 RepID=UPI0026DB5386|nr:uncharacterized protein ONS95_007827 [Cadophora gregata]KAK0126213.1 hypothetical protein ONS95_007827 [Cadophora gregata]